MKFIRLLFCLGVWSLACVPWTASAQVTQVLLPVNSIFGGTAYNRQIIITAANSLISDGNNLWAGSYTTIPASTTNVVIGLYPNDYLLTVPGIITPARFSVPSSTNVLNIVSLITYGPLFYFGSNGLTALAAGPGVIITNIGGTNVAQIDPNLVVTNTQNSITLTNAVFGSTNTTSGAPTVVQTDPSGEGLMDLDLNGNDSPAIWFDWNNNGPARVGGFQFDSGLPPMYWGNGLVSFRDVSSPSSFTYDPIIAGNATVSNFVIQAGSIGTGNGVGFTNVPGVKDPLAVAYMATNNAYDPQALDRLDKYLKRARAMASFSHMRAHFLFNPTYGSSTNADLFGNQITWLQNTIDGNPSYNWGATLYLTNMGTIILPTPNSTNWTIVVTRRNYLAPLKESLSGLTYAWCNDFALENTNSDSFNFIDGNFVRNGWQFYPTYGGALGMSSNVSFSALGMIGNANRGNSPSDVAPVMLTFEANGGGNVFGSQDALLTLFPRSTTVTNLMSAANVYLTNFSPVAKITIGGSTNWNKIFYENSNIGQDKPTNALSEIFDVTYFDTAISSNDLCIYFTAEQELLLSKRQWISYGDSMLAGGNNNVLPFNVGHGSLTNFTMFDFAMRHPLDSWHDWSEGGSTITTATNNFPTKLFSLFPEDQDIVAIEDLIHNDVSVTNAINPLIYSAPLACALNPLVANGIKVWQYESPLPSTNTGSAYFVTNAVFGLNLRTNIISAFYIQHTNRLITKFIHTIAYFNGSVWDTNNGYFGYGTPNSAFINPGFHIEGVNSPTFHNMDAIYWDTTEWPIITITNVQAQ